MSAKTTSSISRSKSSNISNSLKRSQSKQPTLTLPLRYMPRLRSQSRSSPPQDQHDESCAQANTAVTLRPYQSYPPRPSLLSVLQPSSKNYDTTTDFALPSDEGNEAANSGRPQSKATHRPQIIIVQNEFQRRLRDQAAIAKRRSEQDTTTPSSQAPVTADFIPATTPPNTLPESNTHNSLPTLEPTDTSAQNAPATPINNEKKILSTLVSLVARVKKLRRTNRRNLKMVQEFVGRAKMENEEVMVVIRSGLEARLRREKLNQRRREE